MDNGTISAVFSHLNPDRPFETMSSSFQVDPALSRLLAAVMIAYVVIMYAIGLYSRGKVHSAEDYIVAGRHLPFSLAWMTILATWFGAGTLLTAADEVRREGLQAAALDPFGAGFCLIFAGLFVAGPMWRMQLLTVPDFFRRRFGPKSELLASLILVPSYFGWIAAQFVALAGVLELFFGIPTAWGLVIVAVVGTGYTLMGGMWSVTLTDAVQIALVLIGLIVLTPVALAELGQGDIVRGLQTLWTQTPPEKLVVIPTAEFNRLLGWLGVFAVGAFGNVPGQDLMQRVFAARSDRTARWSCVTAGLLYLTVGCMPLVLALTANRVFPEETQSAILPALAHAFLSPAAAAIFVVAILSAVLSTIDSAILSPATVLAQNILPRFTDTDSLVLNRRCVLGVATASLATAYVGETAYALLEEAYALTLVGLFVPLMIGLYSRSTDGRAAFVSMLTGTLLWGVHMVLGWDTFFPSLFAANGVPLPVSLTSTMLGLLAYFVVVPPWQIAWSRDARLEPADSSQLGKSE
mgnify:FL=1